VLRGPRAFYDVASILVTGIDAELSASPAGRPDRACVVPGEIAWDGCDCGAVYVSLRNWSLSDSFPDASDTSGSLRIGPCELPWTVGSIEIQVVRCAPSPDGSVFDVPCNKLDVAAEILIADAALALRRTTVELCQLKDADEIIDYIVGEQLTVGPAGGCVGTSLTVQVATER
jgi:hypothetical protein